MSTLASFVRRQGRAWARRRQGVDRGTIALTGRRIYILPTGQGAAFGAMIFLMLLGSMNYNNSVGLAVTFALTAFGLVVMHHCHRTLSGLQVTLAEAQPVFAGSDALFTLKLDNPATFARLDIGVFSNDRLVDIVTVRPADSCTVRIPLATTHRGRIALERISLRSRYPAGLFQAWAWLNTDLTCLVYPSPNIHAGPPPARDAVDGSSRDSVHGDSDFSGLRDYRPGDPSRRIAWKTYARNDVLTVKTFAGAEAASLFLNLADTSGDIEPRLSTLTRWCLDAHEDGRRFGLALNPVSIAPANGRAHLHQCLRALALHH